MITLYKEKATGRIIWAVLNFRDKQHITADIRDVTTKTFTVCISNKTAVDTPDMIQCIEDAEILANTGFYEKQELENVKIQVVLGFIISLNVEII